jgi:hypothetical protein
VVSFSNSVPNPYPLSEDEFVDVSGEHGAGGEHGGVCGRHDGGGHGSQTEEPHPGRAQVLQAQRENHAHLGRRDRDGARVLRGIPVWKTNG